MTKLDNIILTEDENSWPEKAGHEIQLIKNLIPNKQIISIEHIGSTAIPGLIAKPIIDIEIIPSDFEKIRPLAIEQLKSLDYVYWAQNPDPERLFFVKGMPPYGKQRTHHVHFIHKNSDRCRDKIIFRDYLNTHSEARAEYTKLKQILAAQYADDREKYTKEKSIFIRNTLIQAKSVLGNK